MLFQLPAPRLMAELNSSRLTKGWVFAPQTKPLNFFGARVECKVVERPQPVSGSKPKVV